MAVLPGVRDAAATASRMPRTWQALLHREPLPVLLEGGEWDRLLARSRASTVFLSSGWLRAALACRQPSGSLALLMVRLAGVPIAGMALMLDGHSGRFLGDGPSDYLNLIIDRDLEPPDALTCVREMFSLLRREFPLLRHLILRNIVTEAGTLPLLAACGWHATPFGGTVAPAMAMSHVDAALKKKSLRRHENGFRSTGTLTDTTYTRAVDILPRLPAFFDQHIRRWQTTGHPSPFLDNTQQRLYERLVEELDGSGVLRFTEVRWNDQLIAAHLGMMRAGVYTWYKPTYEPTLADRSPGEVLLKRLMEQAKREEAAEFDFTIGDESFKFRFATLSRDVVHVHLTWQGWRARLFRAWRRFRCAGERVVHGFRAWKRSRHAAPKHAVPSAPSRPD